MLTVVDVKFGISIFFYPCSKVNHLQETVVPYFMGVFREITLHPFQENRLRKT
jgi:hypothetical protein